MTEITEKEAQIELEKKFDDAEELLRDKQKTENFLEDLEEKLKTIPKMGDKLAMVPTMISLVRSYIRKEYTVVPIKTIIAIVGALIYVFIPWDSIPDTIPLLGYIDDIAVIDICLKLISDDIENYRKWRNSK